MQLDPYQEFIFYRTYSRWIEEKKRRETWPETHERYFSFMEEKFGDKVPKKVFTKCRENVLNLDVMGSMRALWAAGPALDANNITGYNCCSMVIKDLQSFVELFYILMCGTGVGFSVENQFIKQLPSVKAQTGEFVGVHVVGDSREGWANALKAGLEAWFDGKDIEFDVSKVRPRGARLKTMGGRASGPAPLLKMLEQVKAIVLDNQGSQLRDIDCLDIGNHIADAVVVGGVRRSSEISFSDLDSDLMRHAKDFPIPNQRFMSNNSVTYNGRPDMLTFMREWTALAASGSGERGIFNVQAASEACARRAVKKLGIEWEEFWKYLRTNPCGEILLMALLGEFCNLSTVVIRAGDTFDDLVEKVTSAVWLGAMQSALTNFPYIRPSFKQVCEEERLLGVSLSGQMDNPDLLTDERLHDLKLIAIKVAKKASKALGINMSAAITCGKPDGTNSQFVNSASGAHRRWSDYYLRRVRVSATDPLFKMMRAQGVQFTPENGQGPRAVIDRRLELITKGRTLEESRVLVPDWTEDQVMTWVCAFPIMSPPGAKTRKDESALDQLEWYLKLKRNWCEHNQSMTVYVKDDEWLKVGSWVWEHFDEIVGITFLPFDGGKYEQAPYEEITGEEYRRLKNAFPKIDYSQLYQFEEDDNTTGAQQYACTGNSCELP
jgi:ribonucleoside-triphosphate reductase